MSHPLVTEEPLQFGAGGRLFGILTQPGVPVHDREARPVFVFFNAGLLHRVGPHRLYVDLARDLARMGFSSLRVDLAGKGDSPTQPGLPSRESAAADYEEIVRVLESRLGPGPRVLAGLCSGADNAIRLSPGDPRVAGLLLLDPVCSPDAGFGARALVMRYTNTARYAAWLKRRLTRAHGNPERVDLMALRDVPAPEQLRSAFASIRERDGRVLSVFTQYALEFYNQAGQLGRVLGVDGYERFCTELFWPEAEHTYTLELHRRRLMEVVGTWAGGFLRPKTAPSMIRVHRRSAVYGEVWHDEEPRGDSGVDIVIYRNRKVPIAGARSTPSLSLVSDLCAGEEAIADGFSKNCRYEIRRAEAKDGLRMELVLEPENRVDEFRAFYDAFARQKSLPLSDRQWLVAACRARQLVLTVASRGAETLVWHAYVTSGNTARLLHSGSCFRNREGDYRALVGRANRWLHWRDMLRLKEMGMQRYDWGGLFEDESAPERAGINNFKKGFGGLRERTYECTVPVTRKGRIWLPIRDTWRRWNPARK